MKCAFLVALLLSTSLTFSLAQPAPGPGPAPGPASGSPSPSTAPAPTPTAATPAPSPVATPPGPDATTPSPTTTSPSDAPGPSPTTTSPSDTPAPGTPGGAPEPAVSPAPQGPNEGEEPNGDEPEAPEGNAPVPDLPPIGLPPLPEFPGEGPEGPEGASPPEAQAPPPEFPSPPPPPGATPPPCRGKPSVCPSRVEYRGRCGCEKCISSQSPWKQIFGGSVCVNPITLSAKSSKCSVMNIPAWPRKRNTSRDKAKCISQKEQVISILVRAIPTTDAPYLTSASYRKTSFRLSGNKGSVRPRSIEGLVLWVKKGNNQLVQFNDRYRTIRSQRGRKIKLTGTVRPYVGATVLRCFTTYLYVCP